MGTITYVAVDRGFLKAGHTATTQYQITTSFEQFPMQFVEHGAKDEALDGTPEGWIQSIQQQYQIRSDLVLAASRADWLEFLTSVAAAETFQIDFGGGDIDLWIPDMTLTEEQVFGIGYRYTFNAKTVP